MAEQYTPTIGKDVIESLTLGMYEDSRFIFREYIQNAADQIDKGYMQGLLQQDQGEIHININADKRIITIEDNATGIQAANVQPILQNIAQSTKIRGIDKGFRGIGRLGGLAYCSKLTFETSFCGESVKSILTWDADLLKKIINDRLNKEQAVEVVKSVTTFLTKKENVEAHYFKVILEGVTSNELLDKKKVEAYLSMVAPVPFSTKFIFRSEIYKELEKEGISLDEYNVFLNTEQIFKAYSTYIYEGEGSSKRAVDEVIDIIFFKEYDHQKKPLYWGWYSVSQLNRQIKQANIARGFRLRKANIQIGDEYTLLDLHRDNRFNFYFFGEVHGISPDLIPNARRDYFSQNGECQEFESKLSGFFHTEIYRLCYNASEVNSLVKKIDDLKAFEEELKAKNTVGFTDKKEVAEFQEKYDIKREEAIRAQKKLEKIEQDATATGTLPIQKIIKRVANPKMREKIEDVEVVNSERPKFRTDNLSSLNKDQRKFLSKIFSIIRDIIEPNLAEELIKKIEEELK
jgi:hypothetical protein